MTTLLSKQQLAQVLLVKLKLRHPEYEFDLNPNAFQDNALVQIHVLQNGEKIFSCSIDKIYSSYQHSPQDLDILCAPLLVMVEEFLTSIQDEKSILLPLVLPRERFDKIQNNYLQKQQTPATLQNLKIFSLPLIANLVITFVLSGTNRLSYLTVEQLNKIYPNQDIHELYPLALDNLSLLVPKLELKKSPPFEVTLHLDHHYELSMLLIFDQWKHLLPFKASPVIAIAARDAIIFANSKRPKQIDALKKMITNMCDYTDPPFVDQLLTIENNTIKLLE
jgi:hypothetical protein